jgi:hypothetical protein
METHLNVSNASLLAPVVRIRPHANNSDDVRVAMSARTNPPDRVDIFTCLCICPLGRSLASEGRRKKRFALALANATAVGELLERGERARSL